MGKQETIDFLYNLQRRGMNAGLENMTRLMESLGCPQRCFPSIHIGGTNGKGSTAAILSSILCSQGMRVGLYTSPHLVEFNERIQINGCPIPDKAFLPLIQEIREHLPKEISSPLKMEEVLQPTFFEVTTALAFLYFAREGVEMAVVEVGMGGRLDATNLLMPMVSVITQIERDHCQYLGSGLEQIALEKAGIIKQGVSVVTAEDKEEPFNVIRSRALEKGSPLIRVGENVKTHGEDPLDFSYRGSIFSLDHLECALKGSHQINNAATAIATLEVLKEKGFSIGSQAIRSGLSRVQWDGRLQVIGEDPPILLDGAHNPSAARMLANALPGFCEGRNGLILVVGILKDKDIDSFFAPLIPLASEVILTCPNYERAAPLSVLEKAMGPYCVPFRSIPLVSEAIDMARFVAKTDDLICVTGSLYTVGEVKAHLEGRVPSLLKG